MRDDRDFTAFGLPERARRPYPPRQPYSELELIAGAGLLLVLLACAAYLVVRAI